CICEKAGFEIETIKATVPKFTQSNMTAMVTATDFDEYQIFTQL
ncbi:13225_t:CDS:1, partial [Funneliformis geosporum]